MTAIIVLIVCSLIVAGGFLFAFLFSVKSGQYDDTVTPAIRMLFDDHGKLNEEVISSQQVLNNSAKKNSAVENNPEKTINPKP